MSVNLGAERATLLTCLDGWARAQSQKELEAWSSVWGFQPRNNSSGYSVCPQIFPARTQPSTEVPTHTLFFFYFGGDDDYFFLSNAEMLPLFFDSEYISFLTLGLLNPQVY